MRRRTGGAKCWSKCGSVVFDQFLSTGSGAEDHVDGCIPSNIFFVAREPDVGRGIGHQCSFLDDHSVHDDIPVVELDPEAGNSLTTFAEFPHSTPLLLVKEESGCSQEVFLELYPSRVVADWQ